MLLYPVSTRCFALTLLLSQRYCLSCKVANIVACETSCRVSLKLLADISNYNLKKNFEVVLLLASISLKTLCNKHN